MTPGLGWRQRKAHLFHAWCLMAVGVGVLLLGVLLVTIVRQGWHWVDWQFLTTFPSRFPEKAGICSAVVGSLWLIAVTAVLAVPLGIGAAVYLEEFSRKGWLATFIEINIANLAGVPSIVYGMLGLAIFVRAFGFDRSILAGACTMSLLILPVIIMAAREALRAVPQSIRWAALALGATRWQTVRAHVIPSAMPGILTGVILAISRAIGEAAPLIMIGALTFVAFVPRGPLDEFTTLPIQIFNWSSRPQVSFHELAAAGIIVLLIVLLSLNAIAVVVRQKYERGQRW